jgi:hypothetical protein
MTFGTIYLDYSAKATIIPLLKGNNYNVEIGYGLQFMEIAVAGFVLSIFITYFGKKEEDIDVEFDMDEKIKEDNSDKTLAELCK